MEFNDMIVFRKHQTYSRHTIDTKDAAIWNDSYWKILYCRTTHYQQKINYAEEIRTKMQKWRCICKDGQMWTPREGRNKKER
ncbi:hypothetical protein T12_7306 [Trichinella patagoniensis]|uniref:Uncharacterized protein n=1 Tax=Trichinella patagoniensis TaxID=990121 RepID=A0A0V0ZNB8_9BILA|nr:hypothetical protein T12_7306 [Trichinella patagoniensis]